MENDDNKVMTMNESVDRIITGWADYFGISKTNIRNRLTKRSPIWEKKRLLAVLNDAGHFCAVPAGAWDTIRIAGQFGHVPRQEQHAADDGRCRLGACGLRLEAAATPPTQLTRVGLR